MASKPQVKSSTPVKKRLAAATPGTGGRFYRNADGRNLMSEQQFLAQQAETDAKQKEAK